MIITANELKTKGVKAIENKLKKDENVLLTVRGKPKYVVMSVEEFDRMREAELELAIIQVEKDIEEGRYTTSLEKHFEELEKDINIK
ncbi:MAG TPA: type II toxin-antitoxin system Phd/YefM family antitoxin [Bacteroidetes bacterium]|nr:type II toxin-antitoxin system Phd/YefM family antitoxin [Bacteroidota bacterium]